MDKNTKIDEVRVRLVETGGRASQDFGLGWIVGQTLVYLYLQPSACSLEQIEEDLGLSKASISVAARQLEQLGLLQRIWVKGERKKYYRSAENIGQALQQGLLSLVRQKVTDFGGELQASIALLEQIDGGNAEEVEFLRLRVSRASKLQTRLNLILGNPLVKLLTRTSDNRNR